MATAHPANDRPQAVLPCGWLLLDGTGQVLACNPALGDLLQAAPEALQGLNFDQLLTGAGRVVYQSYLQPLLRMHGNVQEFGLTLQPRQGEPVDVLFYSARRPAAAVNGAVNGDEAADPVPAAVRVEVLLAPIRRRRDIEGQMLRIKRAADLAPGLIFQLLQQPDGSQHFPYVSEAVRQLYGSTPEQARLSAEAVLGRIVPEDRQALEAGLRAGAGGEADWSGSYRVQAADGSLHWHEMLATPRQLAHGVCVWHGHIADVTARRTMEAALAERAAADRLNQIRGEFLGRISHELRTPLNGLLGFAQLMAGDVHEPLGPAQRDRLAILTAAGEHLLQLVNQVLDISSIESLQPDVPLGPLPVAGVLAQALAIVSPQARAAGIGLPAPGGALGAWALTNELRLRQVLVNLLSNAIKYNQPGGQVRITVATDTAAGQVSLAISDDGPGLSPAQQAALFRPFQRLGAEATATEGSGLGLVITRHLLSLMGGEVQVRSEPGRGSTFVVSLPLQAAPEAASTAEAPAPVSASAPQPDPATPRAARGRLLYVEDDPINLILMESMVGLRPGVQLRVARSGAQALQVLQDNPADLLLLDQHLPDMSGAQLLAAIRQQDLSPQAPAIAVSADTRASDIQAARAAGFADYWTKPLAIDGLLAALDRWLAPPV